MRLKVWSSELGALETNCYIIACPQTGESAVIDPGDDDPWIKRTLEENGLRPAVILLTHGHGDHIGGVAYVKALTGAPVWIHPDDVPMLKDPRLNGSATYGTAPVTAPDPDRLLRSRDTFTIGKLSFQVLHTPGHSPGGVCFYTRGHLIAGDTLFEGSVGRTDLPGGNQEALLRSIRQKLLVLPPETAVYPGHGPTTTIGREKKHNRYL